MQQYHRISVQRDCLFSDERVFLWRLVRGGCNVTSDAPLSYHPTLRTCSSDTILRAIRKLTQDNISYTSDQGKTYDFNTAGRLNTLLINALISTGELKSVEEYDVDFDHQFLETEKYDAKPTYKKFLGYRPSVYVIGDQIVDIENSDGNTNVRFHQADTHKRFFSLLESKGIRVNRFRADCGSCSKEIVSEIEKHFRHFYIRANRCSSLCNDILALRGWKTEEIGRLNRLIDQKNVEIHRLQTKLDNANARIKELEGKIRDDEEMRGTAPNGGSGKPGLNYVLL